MKASDIGRLVAERRRQAGLTQRDLAARIGTTQPAISKIEAGRTLPRLDLIERVALATGQPITVTLGERLSRPTRRQLRARVRRVLGDHPFDPWERKPTPAEAESLLADGLTREHFLRDPAVDDVYLDRLRRAAAPLNSDETLEHQSALAVAAGEHDRIDRRYVLRRIREIERHDPRLGTKMRALDSRIRRRVSRALRTT